MRTVKIAELKNHLSEHLRAVEAGEEVVVTDRDRPIAKIVPLYAEGRIRLIPPSKPFDAVRDMRYEPANWPVDSTTLLREERDKR